MCVGAVTGGCSSEGKGVCAGAGAVVGEGASVGSGAFIGALCRCIQTYPNTVHHSCLVGQCN